MLRRKRIFPLDTRRHFRFRFEGTTKRNKISTLNDYNGILIFSRESSFVFLSTKILSGKNLFRVDCVRLPKKIFSSSSSSSSTHSSVDRSKFSENEWKFLIYIFLTVAKVIETVAAAAVAAAAQKTSTSKASIVLSAQQASTMTSIATSITPSSNSNHTTAVSLAPMKKQRPKTSSPTRHGPQQCQVSVNVNFILKMKAKSSEEKKISFESRNWKGKQ